MIETLTLLRFIILTLLGFGSFLLTIKLIKPPIAMVIHALKWCWVAGLLNFLVDIVQQHFGFWHYTASNLVYGYPLDLYIAVSLALGGAFPLLYIWLRTQSSKKAVFLVFLLNAYFVFQDFLFLKYGGNTFGVIDSTHWWVADIFALAIMLWGTLFVFDYFLKRNIASNI